MYGSLYNDEMPIYKDKIEEQFKGTSEMAQEKGMTVVRWGFDVLVEDTEDKAKAQAFVNECAEKYFPGVKSISDK